MSRGLGFLAETLRIAAPYVAAGLGAVVTERAGVPNVALEGTLIVSSLAGAVVTLAAGSAWAGLAAALLAGALFCLLHGALTQRARVDVIVSGVALNIIAFGLSRVSLRVLYASASNSPRVPGLLDDLSLGPLARAALDPVVVLLSLAIPAVWFVLFRTRFGLRLRAVGEAPEAARDMGVSVTRERLAATAFSGVLCGLGGAHLVLDQHGFTAGMSGGRGFIALAAVLLGRHDPGRTALACLGFAALEAAQIALQDVLRIPSELVQMLPYIATLVLLAFLPRRSGATGWS